jgi:hypothetical protein
MIKTAVLTFTFLLALGVFVPVHVQAGSPFDGLWVGDETYTVYQSATQHANSGPTRVQAMIVIGENGTAFGVLSGLGPGRYACKQKGNKLTFASHLTGTGRTSCTFTLSADGNTLTETGFGLLPGSPYAVECTIAGTFHRKKKK